MRIFVKSKPRAREEKVEKVDEQNYMVAVKEPPEKGKANIAIAKALAKYFKVAFVDIILVSGGTASQKVFDVYLD